jgi:hypothetical protein
MFAWHLTTVSVTEIDKMTILKGCGIFTPSFYISVPINMFACVICLLGT